MASLQSLRCSAVHVHGLSSSPKRCAWTQSIFCAVLCAIGSALSNDLNSDLNSDLTRLQCGGGQSSGTGGLDTHYPN